MAALNSMIVAAAVHIAGYYALRANGNPAIPPDFTRCRTSLTAFDRFEACYRRSTEADEYD